MKCGYVALIGRPNVGKSTLLNHLLGQKISITSRKPQTTRHRVLGIDSTEAGQIIYVDTPGMHAHEKRALSCYLNKTADTTLLGVDLAVLLIDAPMWHEFDEVILKKLRLAAIPAILAVNKIDKVKAKEATLAFFAEALKSFPFQHVVPISALHGTNLERLRSLILDLLPQGEPLYPEEQITDRSERFLAAEIVREKLTRRLGQELPYAVTVEIEKYEEKSNLTKIYAAIWVERESQKSIVIGRQGALLKNVGSDSRQDIEKLLGRKVYLQLWVKVKSGWSDNERALQSLGFNE
jgi:GTP-binding protein Era